MFGVDLNPP